MKSILSLLLFLTFHWCHSQTALINEDFSNGFPPTWNHYYASWSGQHWAILNETLRENSGGFFVATTKQIEMPFVDLSTLPNPVLEFDLAMALVDSNLQFSVQYTTGNNVWTPLLTYFDTTTAITVQRAPDENWIAGPSDYHPITIDLAALTNETNIQFAFVYDYLNAHASGVWFIDNVKLYDKPNISLEENEQNSGFKLYPNPSNSLVHFTPSPNLRNGILRVTNINGKMVMEKRIDFDTLKIDLTSYCSGTYLFIYQKENQTYTEKLVID